MTLTSCQVPTLLRRLFAFSLPATPGEARRRAAEENRRAREERARQARAAEANARALDELDRAARRSPAAGAAPTPGHRPMRPPTEISGTLAEKIYRARNRSGGAR